MIRDDYAGPGGWSEGLRLLGLSDIGIEWDAAACATRAAAGHATIRAEGRLVMFDDAHTRTLLAVLAQDRPTVRTVAAATGCSPSTACVRLSTLRDAGLIAGGAGRGNGGTLRATVTEHFPTPKEIAP